MLRLALIILLSGKLSLMDIVNASFGAPLTLPICLEISALKPNMNAFSYQLLTNTVGIYANGKSLGHRRLVVQVFSLIRRLTFFEGLINQTRFVGVSLLLLPLSLVTRKGGDANVIYHPARI